MNMVIEEIKVVKVGEGLDRLVEVLTCGVSQETVNRLPGLLESALEQLEYDDSFSVEAADELADALCEAQELLMDGQDPREALERVGGLYLQAREEKGFLEAWTERARSFKAEELRTQLWEEFLAAKSLVESGRGRLALGWLRHKVDSFRQSWKSYGALYVSEEEVTMESEMCHHFLRQGIESWLEALTGLISAVNSGVGATRCRSSRKAAEWGQRLLLAVQIFEAEAAYNESRYFVNYN